MFALESNIQMIQAAAANTSLKRKMALKLGDLCRTRHIVVATEGQVLTSARRCRFVYIYCQPSRQSKRTRCEYLVSSINSKIDQEFAK